MKLIPGRNTDLRNAIRSMRMHLTSAHKKKLGGLFILIFISAFFDVFGLAAILPVISATTNPTSVHDSQILSALFQYFDFVSEKNFLLFLVSALLLFFILKSLYGVFVTFVQCKMVSDFAVDLSKLQFSKYFSVPYYEFQNLKTGNITRDVVSNSGSYIQFIVLAIITLLSELIIVLMIVIGIAWYNFQLFAFIFFTVGPAAYLVSKWIRYKSTSIGREVDVNYPLALGAVMQAFSGYIDLKIAGKSDVYRDKFISYQYRFMWNVMKQYLVNQVPFRTNEIVAFLGMTVILVYALVFSAGDQHLITMVGLFAAASYRLMPSINRITNALNFLQTNQPSIHNLNSHYNYFTEELNNRVQQVPVTFEKEIVFENVSFTFPGSERKIINNINFTVNKGEKVGLIGGSGSGKTTLMNLLLRFYEQNSGHIKVDNVSLQKKHIAAWHGKIGYVKQDIFIMDASIRENITLGDMPVNEQMLQSSIRQASLYDFVSSLPAGDETLVGERGSRMSGGQRQRIGIARSLYRNAEILLFDEATSALDMQTEKEVSEAIDKLSGSNKTIIIIAHRITTLKSCSRIYELQNGEISGVYSYNELKEKVFL